MASHAQNIIESIEKRLDFIFISNMSLC